MKKRKEKLANISRGGDDKAQEIITGEESRCWCGQKHVAKERSSQFSINLVTGKVEWSHPLCPTSL